MCLEVRTAKGLTARAAAAGAGARTGMSRHEIFTVGCPPLPHGNRDGMALTDHMDRPIDLDPLPSEKLRVQRPGAGTEQGQGGGHTAAAASTEPGRNREPEQNRIECRERRRHGRPQSRDEEHPQAAGAPGAPPRRIPARVAAPRSRAPPESWRMPTVAGGALLQARRRRMLRRVAAKYDNHSGLEAGGNVQKIVEGALAERPTYPSATPNHQAARARGPGTGRCPAAAGGA